MAGVQCSACSVDMVAVTKKRAVTAAGLVGVVIAVCGIVLALFNLIAGLVVVLIAIVISAVGRGTRTVMTCPSCGAEGRSL